MHSTAQVFCFVLHERYKAMSLRMSTKLREVSGQVDFGSNCLYPQLLVVLRTKKYIMLVIYTTFWRKPYKKLSPVGYLKGERT